MFAEILLSLLMIGTVQAVSIDTDMDGVSDEIDLCKNVPGQNRGCPSIALRKSSGNKINQIIVSRGIKTDKYKFIEKTQIRLGDKIFAVMLDKNTGKIFSKSPSKIMEY